MWSFIIPGVKIKENQAHHNIIYPSLLFEGREPF